MVGKMSIDLYRGQSDRVWRSTGDVVARNWAIDLTWGRNGRVWYCRSLLGMMLKKMTLNISTGDGVVGYGAVYLYW